MSGATQPAGGWTADRLGIRIRDCGGAVGVHELIAVALRRNPRRAHLLVSSVLGKHLPVPPARVRAAGDALGDEVARLLGDSRALTLGFAETATGLGHGVAARTHRPYVHTTRRRSMGVPALEIVEEHSHAPRHVLVPDDSRLLEHGDVAVLVDDELSTGRTAMNLISALHALRPRQRYLIAALVDGRGRAARRALEVFARRLGAQVQVVSLGCASLRVPRGLPARVAAFGTEPAVRQGDPGSPSTVHRWPADGPVDGRLGFLPEHEGAARDAAGRCAAELVAAGLGARVLVLGTEEVMYAPLLLGEALASCLGPTAEVRVSATTRSPAVVLDAPGYPLRSGLAFASHDDPVDGPGVRYVYNLIGAHPDGAASDVVVVVEAATPALYRGDGLLAAIGGTGAAIHVVALPSDMRPGLADGSPLRVRASTAAAVPQVAGR